MRMLCLMDSMSDTELDTCNMKILTDKKRMIRIARALENSTGIHRVARRI